MIIKAARRLVASAVLVSITVTAGCQTDRSPSAAPPASSTPSVDLAQDTASVCVLVVGAVAKGTSTALAEVKQLTSGQLTREEYAQRIRTMFTAVAADLRQLAPRAADPAVRAAIERWAARMDEGAAAADPAAFFTAQYGAVLDEVKTTCKLG